MKVDNNNVFKTQKYNVGVIEKQEMLEMMSSLLQAGGLSPEKSLENITNLFKSLDLNGDGHISEDEFIQAFRDCEYSVYFIIFLFSFLY